MSRYTSLEFMEALGLDYSDYNGATILLRLLASKGIAKEVDKISPTGKGRKMVVYELPDEITLSVTPPKSIPSHPKKKPKKETAEETIEVATETEVAAQESIPAAETPVVASAESGVEWDDGYDDE